MTPQSQSATGTQIQCKHYSPISVYDKHCKFYRNGHCSRTGEHCVEWRKRNAPNPVDVDLFGHPISNPKPKTEKPSTASEKKTAPPPRRSLKPLSGFSPELIESFKRLRTEIHFTSDTGEFWLVPEYLDRSRGEITPEHLALICKVLMAFPGATVAAFETISPNKEEENSDDNI